MQPAFVCRCGAGLCLLCSLAVLDGTVAKTVLFWEMAQAHSIWPQQEAPACLPVSQEKAEPLLFYSELSTTGSPLQKPQKTHDRRKGGKGHNVGEGRPKNRGKKMPKAGGRGPSDDENWPQISDHELGFYASCAISPPSCKQCSGQF